MIIKEIELKDIRSHLNTKLAFSNGINVITGNTGSGKSSILMGVQYALFGKIGEGQGEGKLLLRQGKSSGSISLKFEEDSVEYVITRGLKRIKDAVRNDDSMNAISKNGAMIDLQNRAMDLNSYVLKILKINSPAPIKTFEAITYIKQDELKDLIFETGQSKQEYIDQLLQLSKYADAFDRLKEVIDKIRTEIETNRIEASLTGDENEIIQLESKIGELQLLNADAIKNLNSLESESKNTGIKIKQIESDLKFYRERKNEYIKLNAERDGKIMLIGKFEKRENELNSSIDLKEKNIVKIDEKRITDLKTAKNAKENSLRTAMENEKEVYGKVCELEAEKTGIAKNLGKLEDEIKTTREQNKKLEIEKASVKELLDKAAAILNEDEINGRINQLKNTIEELKSEKASALKQGICLICGDKIKDKEHLEREYSKKVAECETIILKLTKEKEKGITGRAKKDLERDYERFSIKISDNLERIKADENDLTKYNLKDLSEKLSLLKKDYENAARMSKKIKAEIEDIDKEVESIEAIRNIINEIKAERAEIQRLRVDIQKTAEEIKLKEEEINKVDFNQNELQKRENEFSETMKILSSISSGIAEINGSIKARNSDIADKTKKLEEVKTKMKKVEEMRIRLEKKDRFLTLMENLRKDIRDIREYVRNKFIAEFKALFWTRFLEIRNESDYSIDIDNNYNIKVNVGNEVLDAKTLSGGEKTSVALAYRMALSSIASVLGGVNKNESLIMDEPTSGLDKEDINALSTCITKIRDLNQIIIVTHEDIMKNIADNLISVSKVSGESVVYTSK